MRKPPADATKCYPTLRTTALSVAQETAIDALASGLTDAEAAARVGVHRVTVTRWRLYHPPFIAALNERRRAIWAGSLDRLRSLVPVALDAVADVLHDPDHPGRLRAAFDLLKLVPITEAVTPTGPTDPDAIVQQIVAERREVARGPLDDYRDNTANPWLPKYDDHVEHVWAELAAKAEPPAPDTDS